MPLRLRTSMSLYIYVRMALPPVNEQAAEGFERIRGVLLQSRWTAG